MRRKNAKKHGGYKLKKYERNGVETITDSYKILRLDEKHFKKWLDHKKSQVTIVKHRNKNGKHRHELVDKLEKKPNRIFKSKELATKGMYELQNNSST